MNAATVTFLKRIAGPHRIVAVLFALFESHICFSEQRHGINYSEFDAFVTLDAGNAVLYRP